MARTDDPNSADSQFFIVMNNYPDWDGKYTVWGYVTEGMEHVDKIKPGSRVLNGRVDSPDSIVKMQMASDVAAAEPAIEMEQTSEQAAGETESAPKRKPNLLLKKAC